ncbi:hypothetical protein ZIOFF_062770 [Zingiber officinale]|uniref:Uncharacterized protein n=1 Tax=Zingiber officinale TaxID=94328 RepID=A0A8J5KF72_ZINOF|nr:hypothetical protein ZIOFF_062770 [Zingiber officinale]
MPQPDATARHQSLAGHQLPKLSPFSPSSLLSHDPRRRKHPLLGIIVTVAGRVELTKGLRIRYAFELLTNALWKRDYDLFGIDEHSESFLVGEFQVLVTSMVYSGSLRCAHAIHQCLEEEREKIMTIPRKEKKRKAMREEKAEKAAVLDMVFRRCTWCLEDAQVEKI